LGPTPSVFLSDYETISTTKLFYGAPWNSVETFLKNLFEARMIFVKTVSMVVTSYLGAQPT